MTIDEGYVSTYELMRRTEEQDREQYRRECEERDETESIDARESYWCGVMRQQPYWMRNVHYDSGPG